MITIEKYYYFRKDINEAALIHSNYNCVLENIEQVFAESCKPLHNMKTFWKLNINWFVSYNAIRCRVLISYRDQTLISYSDRDTSI